MKTRRNFLKKSALATGSLLIPKLFKAFENPGYLSDNEDRKLIIIQFAGGNDGLNSVIPFTNDIYYRNRPNIAIPSNKVIRLNDTLGLNPAMPGIKRLYDQGELCVVNNVGYPNPVRSHFRSMDIWETASDANEVLNDGWLGRYFDICKNCPDWHILNMDELLHLAVRGENRSGFAMGSIQNIKNATSSPSVRGISHLVDHDNHMVDYLYSTLSSTVSSTDYIYDQLAVYNSSQTYPNSAFGRSCKQVAELIISGATSKVFYLSHGTFDTHYGQVPVQEKLLSQFSEGVYTLTQELKSHNLFKNTLIMAFSEFGRRVQENGSQGTDHGTANNIYLFSGALKKPGLYNDGPDLVNLVEGDLAFKIDFRQIYATLLENWLNTPSQQILNQSFTPLDMI